MKYNEHIGQVYDVIYYGVIYFNKPSVIKKFTERKHNLDGAFSFFEEVKNSCKPLPQCLYPFFYYDSVTPSVLSEYMREHINFHKHKMQDYLNIIQNKTKLKKYVFDHLFGNLSDNDRNKLLEKDSATVYSVFDNQQWENTMKDQTTLLVYNFSYAADTLYEYLKEIYKHINYLHTKYSDIINQLIEETTKKEMLILFEKSYSLNEIAANKQFFSLCFMHQFIYWNENSKYKEFIFIFGIKYKESLYNNCNNNPISAEKILHLLGDPIRFNIINLLKKNKFLTQSDISRLANISSSTAFSVTNFLWDEAVIKKNHQDGRKIYFKLNNDFFIMAEDIISNFFKYMKSMED